MQLYADPARDPNRHHAWFMDQVQLKEAQRQQALAGHHQGGGQGVFGSAFGGAAQQQSHQQLGSGQGTFGSGAVGQRAGGGNQKPCRYGAKCTRADCKFAHPPGHMNGITPSGGGGGGGSFGMMSNVSGASGGATTFGGTGIGGPSVSGTSLGGTSAVGTTASHVGAFTFTPGGGTPATLSGAGGVSLAPLNAAAPAAPPVPGTAAAVPGVGLGQLPGALPAQTASAVDSATTELPPDSTAAFSARNFELGHVPLQAPPEAICT